MIQSKAHLHLSMARNADEGIKLEESGVVKRLYEDGRSEFAFSCISDTPEICPLPDMERHLEVGIFTCRSYKIGDVLLSDTAICAIPMGRHRRRVCWKCFCVSSKVKVQEGIDICNYCSLKCLQDDSTFLERFGAAIQYVQENNQNLVDIFSLVFRVLHTYEENYFEMKWLKQLYTPERTEMDTEELEIKDTILELGLIDCDSTLLGHVHRICRYNAQILRLALRLTDTYIITLMPTLSRLNHSCRPNAVLNATLQDGGKFTISAIACNDISVGGEIHMSYLRDASMRVDMRSQLLKNFCFECKCKRCQDEKISSEHVNTIKSIGEALEYVEKTEDISRRVSELYVCQNIALECVNTNNAADPDKNPKLTAYYILAKVSSGLGLRLASLSRIELLLAGCHLFLQARDPSRVTMRDKSLFRFMVEEATTCLSLLNRGFDHGKNCDGGILLDMLKLAQQFESVLNSLK